MQISWSKSCKGGGGLSSSEIFDCSYVCGAEIAFYVRWSTHPALRDTGSTDTLTTFISLWTPHHLGQSLMPASLVRRCPSVLSRFRSTQEIDDSLMAAVIHCMCERLSSLQPGPIQHQYAAYKHSYVMVYSSLMCRSQIRTELSPEPLDLLHSVTVFR